MTMDTSERSVIIELGCAEIPASYIPPAIEHLKKSIKNELDKMALPYGDVYVTATPRRLVINISDIARQGRDLTEEARGPSANVAFDDDNNPTRAAEGFANSQGVAIDDLEIIEEEKGKYVYAVHKYPGKDATKILAEIMPSVFSNLQFPRTMRWGRGEHSFARPVRWILALCGNEVIPFEFAGIESGRQSFGPRFNPEQLRVASAEDYWNELNEADVCVDHNLRRKLIKRDCEKASAQVDGRPVIDADVLQEVVFLVENPAVVLGEIPENYMKVPRIVVQTAMSSHLRFFPVENDAGKMMPHFLSVINGTEEMKRSVLEGNELVLNSRLADAKFFWEEDLSRDLEDYAEHLQEVLQHEEIGTYADKVERMKQLGRYLVEEHLIDDNKSVHLERAIELCKADLVTQMVQEFPSLQGAVGREYAKVAEEADSVCEAIGEHYLPSASDDPTPDTDLGSWLSVIDKIDDLVGAFVVSLEVSGSEDPYGLRRSANGVLRILSSFQGISVRVLLQKSLATHSVTEKDQAGEVIADLEQFFRSRLERMMRNEGYSADLVRGVLSRGFDDVSDAWKRCEAVDSFLKESGKVDDFMTAWRRCHNLADKGDSSGELGPDNYSDPEIKELCSEFLRLKDKGLETLRQGEYVKFFEIMAKLRPDIDSVMDSVMIMDPDENTRKHKLNLLAQIDELLCRPVDWSELPGRSERC